MRLSELIAKMQATLNINGDTEVGVCLVMGRTTKYRLDAFGDVDVLHSDGEYINGMTYLIAEYNEHGHEPPNALAQVSEPQRGEASTGATGSTASGD